MSLLIFLLHTYFRDIKAFLIYLMDKHTYIHTHNNRYLNNNNDEHREWSVLEFFFSVAGSWITTSKCNKIKFWCLFSSYVHIFNPLYTSLPFVPIQKKKKCIFARAFVFHHSTYSYKKQGHIYFFKGNMFYSVKLNSNENEYVRWYMSHDEGGGRKISAT